MYIVIALACCAISLTLLFSSTFMIVEVQGESMIPTFQIGEHVLVRKFGIKINKMKGKVVIIQHPIQANSDRRNFPYYIKRVVTLPHEMYTTHYSNHKDDTEKTCFVPENHIFVQSDSKKGGLDSRAWGPIPITYVKGVVIKKLR